MTKKKHIENWDKSKLEHKKQMEIWNELLPDGFVDVEIKENLTGKAVVPNTYMPPKGRSSID